MRRRRKEQQEEQVRQEATEYTWELYEEKYPDGQVAIARELFSRIDHYATDHEMPWPWHPALRSYYMGFQRPGGYYVALVGLRSEKPLQFAVKLPDDPARLDLVNPYPELADYWDEHNRQWCWDLPSLDRIPDISQALDIALSFQPLTGPMPHPDSHGREPPVASAS